MRLYFEAMVEIDGSSNELEERARKREAIGLSPHRPTAKDVVHSPPEATRRFPFPLLVVAGLVVAAATVVLWRTSFFPLTLPGREPATIEEGRLIEKDDFSEPGFALPEEKNEESDLGFVGDLYRIWITRPGSRAWAALGRQELGAFRVDADLRLASQEAFAGGYGGLVVRYQNDESFYLFVIDNRRQYQIELVDQGAWRTLRPWDETAALSDGRQNVLSVADDGTELRFYINYVLVDTVTDPRLPAGDAGLVVGARSRGQGQGLFDWVALYEIGVAEKKVREPGRRLQLGWESCCCATVGAKSSERDFGSDDVKCPDFGGGHRPVTELIVEERPDHRVDG